MLGVGQGSRTCGTRTQNDTREVFFATRRSLLSQVFLIPFARPASIYSEECVSIYVYIYRVSQEERTKLREGVPYVKLYQYNPKHLYPKLNGYGDNDKRSLKL